MSSALWTAFWAFTVAAIICGWFWLKAPAHAAPACPGTLGIASWYGAESGSRTASGEPFDGRGMTAASRTLPFGTLVWVTDLATGRSVVVRINDRGPAAWTGRMIDLSRAAAQRLGIAGQGTARVCIGATGR